MKMILAGLAALSFVAPAAAQEWPQQDWRVSKITNMSVQLPISALSDGGVSMTYPAGLYSPERRNIRPAPAGRQNLAVDVGSIQRQGKVALVRYFVWPEDKSSYTEISSRIDCGRTGEQINAVRVYDEGFSLIGGHDQKLRRTDATARAVATQVCGAARTNVSGKSLPEIVKGG
ncbi:hypothetical protein [Caulobacter endophyticus]|uniref:hypothetical protein n=1 Tax=Caulobacter endophyticus TaxID=2172652 RepID=UPI00240FCE35|nr:hypothetical protein [Caulobacter endophyticus]MDG2528370.1 hypothetical protein [Caulobacter endophyticus]